MRVDTHVSPKPLSWKALPSGLKELELFFPWGGRLVFGGFLGREVQGNFLSVPSLSSQILQVCALMLALRPQQTQPVSAFLWHRIKAGWWKAIFLWFEGVHIHQKPLLCLLVPAVSEPGVRGLRGLLRKSPLFCHLQSHLAVVSLLHKRLRPGFFFSPGGETRSD